MGPSTAQPQSSINIDQSTSWKGSNPAARTGSCAATELLVSLVAGSGPGFQFVSKLWYGNAKNWVPKLTESFKAFADTLGALLGLLQGFLEAIENRKGNGTADAA